MPFLLFGALVAATWALARHPLPALGRLGRRAVRRAAGLALRGGPFRRLVAVGLATALAAGVAFLHIAEMLQEKSALLDELDRGLAQRARGLRTDASTRFFLAAAWLGQGWTLAVIVAAVAALLAARGKYRWAGYLVTTSSLGGLLNLALKTHYHRARPDVSEAIYLARGYSFPSGHAMGAVVVFGALAYLACRQFRDPERRAFALSLAFCLIVAISASRVYLGVHWLSDISAGAIAGTLWVVTTTASYEGVRRLYALRRTLAEATTKASN
ncbi:MAG: phosphatase PAP2 family protein [Polyangiaceae bacterium]|nr:phosphatase PAP2 family protein [Polyangiaceae bacterium]